jgi:NAD-dependent deacetylase
MRMRIFVITGAGVSAESGLGTFRDKGGTGIWARFDPMKLATPEAFARDPHEVYAFYNARRQNLIAAKPNVAHSHGELLKARCTACERVISWCEDLGLRDQCSACGRTGTLRPHVVWFGEMPLQIDAIYAALNDADLFVAIGTSGSVYPAAGFVSEARALGIRTCEINLEPSDNVDQFDERRYGLASGAVQAWVDEVLTLK